MQSYLNLTPTPAWSLSKGLATNPNNRMDDSFSRVAGDFDGDGRAELAFFSGDGSTLGICSYLFWNDLTATPPYNLTYLQNAWQDAGPGPIVLMSFQQSKAPAAGGGESAWPFLVTDRRCAADLDGDGADEILFFNPQALTIGVCSWSNSDCQVETIWRTQGSVPAAVSGGLLHPDSSVPG